MHAAGICADPDELDDIYSTQPSILAGCVEKLEIEKDPNAYAFLGNEYVAIGENLKAEECYKIAIKSASFKDHKARAMLYFAQLFFMKRNMTLRPRSYLSC